MAQKKRMVFNAFVMNTPSHMYQGMWRHPDAKWTSYTDLEVWTDFAKTAERGMFDAVFFADVFGLHTKFAGSHDPIMEKALQFPVNDPSVMVSAMAAATENLGFVYTNSCLQQHPFNFARVMSTLDHLTKGRMGWNIVTSFSENGSRSMGLETMVEHDERYVWAAEYAEVTYKLWESSWEDDAVIQDRENSKYIDPAKIHKINHVGKRYNVEGPHLVQPSPQRTPVLFQAGTSAAGQAFAGANAEGVFIVSGSPEAAAKRIKAGRQAAIDAGRDADDVLFIEGITVIVAPTEEEAQRKAVDYEKYMDYDAEMMLFGATTGIDFSELTPESPLSELFDRAPGLRGPLQMVIDSMPEGQTAKVSDMMKASKLGRLVGTPESIADQLEAYQAAGVDGFNLMQMVLPNTLTDFVDLVVPELQRRGLVQHEYAKGTLREKLFEGRGPRLVETHPAAKTRNFVSQ